MSDRTARTGDRTAEVDSTVGAAAMASHGKPKRYQRHYSNGLERQKLSVVIIGIKWKVVFALGHILRFQWASPESGVATLTGQGGGRQTASAVASFQVSGSTD